MERAGHPANFLPRLTALSVYRVDIVDHRRWSVLLDNGASYHQQLIAMQGFSTRGAAKKLGIEQSTLSKYLKRGKVPAPLTVKQGKRLSQVWTEEDIERVRKLLPKIANGRKSRWQRQREEQKKQAPARAPVPHKQGSRKQKRFKKK
jgi:predicted transcriptional regulator